MFMPIAGQVKLMQGPPVLSQGQMPGWNPSGSPAFMRAAQQVYQDQGVLPQTPASAPSSPPPAATATAIPLAPPPSPTSSGLSMLAIGIGVGAFALGTIIAITSGGK